MEISPEMRELRDSLSANGIEYIADDAEGETDEWTGFVVHSEITTFRASDGRLFEASYAWSRDEDGQKRFITPFARYGYLECRIGDAPPFAASVGEIMEDAIGGVM